MDYDKKLITKAINKRCDICKYVITETEANNQEFHYSQTKGKRDIFVHIKCWLKSWGGRTLKENWYAFLICIIRPDFTIDRSTTYMLDGRLRKNLPKGEGIDEIVRMKSQGMTHKEIGEIFGISKDAVHKRIQRYKEARAV